MLKNIARLACITCMAFLIAGPINLQAQGDVDPPPTDGGPGCCEGGPDGGPDGGTTDLPMDGGISLLVGAGVAYGLRRARYQDGKKSLRKINN